MKETTDYGRMVEKIWEESQIEALSLLMTGVSGDPLEAFEQWEREREALAELYDENQAMKIINRRLRLCLILAEQAVKAAETEAGMFITEKTRGKVAAFLRQSGQLAETKAHGQMITEGVK